MVPPKPLKVFDITLHNNLKYRFLVKKPERGPCKKDTDIFGLFLLFESGGKKTDLGIILEDDHKIGDLRRALSSRESITGMIESIESFAKVGTKIRYVF